MEYIASKKNDELMHYGVPGMKWGVRRSKRDTSSSSRKTYKSDRLIDKYEKSGNVSAKKLQKQQQKYIKEAGKDLKRAQKRNDTESFKRISAGRTYAKMLSDSSYFNRALTDAAVNAKAEVGKDFKYRVTKNDKAGTVDINVNGKTSSYLYAPELDKRR